jgi:hypothetical protein
MILVSLNAASDDAGEFAAGNTNATRHFGHRTREPRSLISPRTRCPLGQLHVIFETLSFMASPHLFLVREQTKAFVAAISTNFIVISFGENSLIFAAPLARTLRHPKGNIYAVRGT